MFYTTVLWVYAIKSNFQNDKVTETLYTTVLGFMQLNLTSKMTK